MHPLTKNWLEPKAKPPLPSVTKLRFVQIGDTHYIKQYGDSSNKILTISEPWKSYYSIWSNHFRLCHFGISHITTRGLLRNGSGCSGRLLSNHERSQRVSHDHFCSSANFCHLCLPSIEHALLSACKQVRGCP